MKDQDFYMLTCSCCGELIGPVFVDQNDMHQFGKFFTSIEAANQAVIQLRKIIPHFEKKGVKIVQVEISPK